MMKVSNLSKIYTILIVAFPILHVYGTGLSTVSFADLLLLIMYPLLIVRNKWNKVSLSFLLYAFYICIVGFFLHPNESIFKTLRYLCYILALALFSDSIFNFEYGKHVLLKLALFATFFLFFQYICFHLLGYYVPGYLPGIPIMRSELVLHASSIGVDGGDLRVRSIFGEPAHYAQYIVGCIALMIGSSQKNVKWALFLFLGLLLSGSSTGILAGGFLLMFLFPQVRKIRFKPYVWYLLFLIVGIGLYLISLSSFYKAAIDKLVDNRTFDGRFSGIEILLSRIDYSNADFLFGHGIGSTGIYLPGYLMLFYYLGAMALLIYICINISIFFRVDRSRKILLLLFALLNIGTEVVMGPFILLFFSFLLSKNRVDYDT